MNNMAIYRLAVLCLVVIVPVTLGCTCSPRTNRQKFCDADFGRYIDILPFRTDTNTTIEHVVLWFEIRVHL